jgi:DNA adenine methylase
MLSRVGGASASSSAEARVRKALQKYYLSPLRYPGGKRKLAARIALQMDCHGISGFERIFEPFVGGASVSIAFLESGIADRAVISDLDPLVADFWATVFSSRADALADRVLDAEVSLDEWRRLRADDPKSQIDRAFKCLFLNRTSFSGALSETAGPIGGMAQASEYKIECRYNRYALAERIWELSRLSHRVSVRNTDFRRLIASYRAAATRRRIVPNDFWYLDPPFFHKADRLYRLWFADDDHRALRERLTSLPGRWFLSYDNCPEARASLRSLPGYALADMRYTANKKSMIDDISSKEVTAHNFAQTARLVNEDVFGDRARTGEEQDAGAIPVTREPNTKLDANVRP